MAQSIAQGASGKGDAFDPGAQPGPGNAPAPPKEGSFGQMGKESGKDSWHKRKVEKSASEKKELGDHAHASAPKKAASRDAPQHSSLAHTEELHGDGIHANGSIEDLNGTS